MAGGEGERKEQKWQIFDAVICMRAREKSVEGVEHLCMVAVKHGQSLTYK